jgi:excisionase family DNA binding protein
MNRHTSLTINQLIDLIADHIAESVAERLDSLKPRQTDRLVDEMEMAELLGVSSQTLQRIRTAGEVPCIRVGRRVLYRPADVFDSLSSEREEVIL